MIHLIVGNTVEGVTDYYPGGMPMPGRNVVKLPLRLPRPRERPRDRERSVSITFMGC